MRLEDMISKEIYEKRHSAFKSDLEKLLDEKVELEALVSEEKCISDNIKEFKESLEKDGTALKEFKREIFEETIDKVIVGLDEDGNNNPYALDFIYKTGFKNRQNGEDYTPNRGKKK